MFYKNIGIDINMDNYRLLFICQDKFIKRYGLSNKELINLYQQQIRLLKLKKGQD